MVVFLEVLGILVAVAGLFLSGWFAHELFESSKSEKKLYELRKENCILGLKNFDLQNELRNKSWEIIELQRENMMYHRSNYQLINELKSCQNKCSCENCPHKGADE